MRKMKTAAAGILLFMLILSTAGCGKTEQMICTATNNNVVMQITYEAKDDLITKIIQTSRIVTANLSDEQLDATKASVTEAEANYKDIDGVTYATEEKDGEIIETIVIEGNEDTLKKVTSAGLMPADSEETSSLSLAQTRQAMEAAGWTVRDK